MPPVDISPLNDEFAVTIGLLECPETPTSLLPSSLLVEGVPSVQGPFRFTEFALDMVNGVLTEVDLGGQTIDWSLSQIASSGIHTYELGIFRKFRLQGKPYALRQYTFLRGEFSFLEDGVAKSDVFTVRMKHF